MVRHLFLNLIVGASLVLSFAQGSAAQTGKENIESGTLAYRIVKYQRNAEFTCTAMICEKRDSHQCGVNDGLFSISKRTEADLVYLSYYPVEREASRKLKTRIRIGSFRSRSFLPIQDYAETWVVPDITKNEDMFYEMEREARLGDIVILIETETFDERRMTVRDLDGMRRDVTRLCPTNGG